MMIDESKAPNIAIGNYIKRRLSIRVDDVNMLGAMFLYVTLEVTRREESGGWCAAGGFAECRCVQPLMEIQKSYMLCNRR